MNETRKNVQYRTIKKKKNYFACFLSFSATVLSVMFVLSLPVFNIKDVEIDGNNIVSDDIIKKELGFYELQNIFSFSSPKAKKTLLKNPYIKSVKIKKEYPDKIDIEIIERKPRAYVELKNMDSYVLIDETGMVLEAASYAKEELPVIVGLNTSFAIGQVLMAENTKSFEDVVLLSNLFDKYELTRRMRVEVSDEKNIHIYIGNVDVIFGGIDYADEKMSTVKAALPKIPEGARGFLDVKDNNDKVIFKYLK